MSAKKPEDAPMSRSFIVTWPKGDAREALVEKAIDHTDTVRMELVRDLLEEWARLVLARDDIKAASAAVAKRTKKK